MESWKGHIHIYVFLHKSIDVMVCTGAMQLGNSLNEPLHNSPCDGVVGPIFINGQIIFRSCPSSY